MTFSNAVVDATTSAIQEAFSTLEIVGEKFGVLTHLGYLTFEWLTKQCMDLSTALSFAGQSKLYGIELEQDLKSLSDLPSRNMSFFELLAFIHKRGLPEICPSLWTVPRIGLTLPITIAEAERSFSKLKLMKYHLRLAMSQERPIGLVMISRNQLLSRFHMMILFMTLQQFC